MSRRSCNQNGAATLLGHVVSQIESVQPVIPRAGKVSVARPSTGARTVGTDHVIASAAALLRLRDHIHRGAVDDRRTQRADRGIYRRTKHFAATELATVRWPFGPVRFDQISRRYGQRARPRRSTV